MAVLTSGERRSENEKVYRRRVSVEKSDVRINLLISMV
jgi:hypothetical protein